MRTRTSTTAIALVIALAASGWGQSRDIAREVRSGPAARMVLAAVHDPGSQLEALAARLGALPPDAVGEVFQILETGVVGPLAGSSEGVELDEQTRSHVLASFALQSPTAVRAYLARLAGRELPESARDTALLVLGEMGTALDVRTVVQLGAAPDPDVPVTRAIRVAATEALARIIARDPKSLWRLSGAFGEAHEGLLAAFPAAIRLAHPPEGLQVLTDLLGLAPEADALILAEIGLFGEAVPGVVDPMTLESVRAYLGRTDARLVHGAALAVRRLDDTRSVPELLRLLGHHDANVRRSADLALRRITGRHFHGDQERWHAWHVEQQRWWWHDAPRLINDLSAGERGVVARALNEMSTHRIYRADLEPALVGALTDLDSGVVVLACSVIGKLGSRSAIPELNELLESPDSTVATAAQGAIRRILGSEHTTARTIVQR